MPVGKLLPEAAYGVVLKAFPLLLSTFFLIVALAASISTATTASIGAVSTFIRDIYHRLWRPNATSAELVVPSRIVSVVLGLATWILCFFPGGPAFLFAFGVSWLGPPSIVFMMGMLWRRVTEKGLSGRVWSPRVF